MNKKVNRLLQFVTLTHSYQQIQRQILATGENRNENDAEHGYQLAMIAWYIVTSRTLDLDLNLVIKYALSHDLVEAYAGDTPFFTTDKTLRASKPEREQKALKKIQLNFPEFRELASYIDDYERKDNKEARFVYALDKIIPVMNIFLDNGKTWQRDKITYAMIRTKDEKVKVSPEAYEIWLELMKVLDNKKNLFFKEKE